MKILIEFCASRCACCTLAQPRKMPLFFAMFKTLEGKSILVELKNSLQIRGRLLSVDQYLNMKLEDIEITDRANFPQLVRGCRRAALPPQLPCPLCSCGPLTPPSPHAIPKPRALCHRTPPMHFCGSQLSVRSLFVRGGVVRYVQLPPDAVDTDLLQDASRKEAAEAAKGKR